MTKISNYARPGSAALIYPSTPGTLAAVTSVTDGSTTVAPASSIDFTSGATVTDGGGGVAQVSVTGAFTSPMTTEGDMIYQHSGVAARLPIGTAGQVLAVVSGDPAWTTATVWRPLMAKDPGSGIWQVVVAADGSAIMTS